MIKTNNPDFKNTILQKLKNPSFLHLIGFQVTNIAEGLIEGELVLTQLHKQNKGFVHGGLSATVADTVMGYAAVSLIPENTHVVTVDLTISYFKPGIGDKLLGKGWVVKQGKKMNFCEAEIFCKMGNAEPVLIAKARATMAIISLDEAPN